MTLASTNGPNVPSCKILKILSSLFNRNSLNVAGVFYELVNENVLVDTEKNCACDANSFKAVVKVAHELG